MNCPVSIEWLWTSAKFNLKSQPYFHNILPKDSFPCSTSEKKNENWRNKLLRKLHSVIKWNFNHDFFFRYRPHLRGMIAIYQKYWITFTLNIFVCVVNWFHEWTLKICFCYYVLLDKKPLCILLALIKSLTLGIWGNSMNNHNSTHSFVTMLTNYNAIERFQSIFNSFWRYIECIIIETVWFV